MTDALGEIASLSARSPDADRSEGMGQRWGVVARRTPQAHLEPPRLRGLRFAPVYASLQEVHIQDLTPRGPEASTSEITELMMPGHVNNLGHVFGGVLLSMIDRAAAVAAMRHAGQPCVTVSINQVDFREPIYAGELVICTARVNYVGRTSMEIGVKVVAEHPITRTRRHTNDCFLTFVAIDENSRPAPVPPLELTTDEERQRFEEGKLRREHREALDLELRS